MTNQDEVHVRSRGRAPKLLTTYYLLLTTYYLLLTTYYLLLTTYYLLFPISCLLLTTYYLLYYLLLAICYWLLANYC